MKETRPINLDLSSLRFPPMAIASILHRISGIVLFLLLPAMLCLLDCSLKDENTFAQMNQYFANAGWKLILWAFCSAWGYHVFAGIRHLMMDMGIGESLKAGRASAVLVLLLGSILVLFLGIRIW